MTGTRKKLGAVLAFSLAMTFGIFVWPTSYRYDRMNVGEGRSLPVRVNRLTGKTEILYPSGWRVAGGSKQEPAIELTPEEIKNLSGNAVITDFGHIEAEIYNGTNKKIRDITVSVTVRNVGKGDIFDKVAGGEKVLPHVVFTREYVLTPEYSSLTRPLASAKYKANLGYKIAANQDFSWNIVRASGEKADRD